jgi:hypothetical protein
VAVNGEQSTDQNEAGRSVRRNPSEAGPHSVSMTLQVKQR